MSKAWSSKIMKKASALAEIIREHKAITFGELSVKGDIAPSTLYNYTKIILSHFKDIKYENGVFSVVAVETHGSLRP